MTTVQVSIPITKPDVGDAELERLAAVVRSGWLTQGAETFEFERVVAERTGARHGVATTSATTALHIAFVLLGVGPGDEVLLPSYTHIATANAVRYTGATPRFVDIRPDTYNIDERLLEQAVTANTRAILAVDQVGLPAELEAICGIASRHGLRVVEDAACALGSIYRGKPIGSISDLTVFSFHPRKVITTGEGGMVMTNDDAWAEEARSLVSHGESVLDVDRHSAARPLVEEFPRLGFNYRLTNLQGALGVAQMARLDGIVEARRRLAGRYNEAFGGLAGIEPPVEPEGVEPNYQSYMVRVTERSATKRDELMAKLREHGIASRPGITAIHRQPIYRSDAIELPETDRAADTCLILPLFPRMTAAEQEAVIQRVTSLTEGTE
jgi:dTDP-4-amino-4,6-dideoxygalactose transaminase